MNTQIYMYPNWSMCDIVHTFFCPRHRKCFYPDCLCVQNLLYQLIWSQFSTWAVDELLSFSNNIKNVSWIILFLLCFSHSHSQYCVWYHKQCQRHFKIKNEKQNQWKGERKGRKKKIKVWIQIFWDKYFHHLKFLWMIIILFFLEKIYGN